MLTGYSVGGMSCHLCGHAARPVRSCSPASSPHINLDGQWVNACGCQTDCSCTAVSEIILPGSSASSETSPSTEWSSPRLPTVSTTTPGWCGRTGTSGPPVKTWDSRPERSGRSPSNFSPPRPLMRGAYVGGILACEYAKACSGDRKCKLPSGVTEITRRGITMSIQQGMLPRDTRASGRSTPILRDRTRTAWKVPADSLVAGSAPGPRHHLRRLTCRPSSSSRSEG